MAASSLKLQVMLQALDRASGPMRRILGGSTALKKSLLATSNELKDLNRQQSKLDGFRRLKNEVGQTAMRMRQAQQRVAALRAEVAATEKPTRQLAYDLRRAEKAADGARAKFIQTAQALRQSRGELEAAGISARKFGEHESRLKKRIDDTTAAMREQQRRLGQLDKARAMSEKMHRGGMIATMHGAGAVAGGAMAAGQARSAMQPGIDFESTMRDVAITGELDRGAEARLGLQIRQDALRHAQTVENISAGIKVLVANGLKGESELRFYSGLLAKGGVATGADGADLSSTFTALKLNLKMMQGDMAPALDGLTWQGKQGSFELRDMAKWLPVLTPQMAALGATGRQAAFDLGAGLQIARRGAGTNDEAANNFRNFLAKITAPDTLKDFSRAGINLQDRLMKLQAQGVNPLMGSLQVIEEYMAKKGPGAVAKYRKAMTLKDDAERTAALDQLARAYELGDLFQDMQAMAFVKVALANKQDLGKISSGANSATGTIDADWTARMGTGQKQLDRFSIRMNELKLQAAGILMPALNSLAQSASRVLDVVTAWANRNPELAGGILKVVVAGAAIVTVIGGLLVAGGMAAMMLGNLNTAVLLLSGGRGGIGMLARGMASLVGRGFMAVLRVVPMVGTALRVLGAAMLTNPVGLILTGIAVAAYLIYRNWDRIGPWFSALWEGIKGAASTAWEWIKGIFAWTPLGLVISNWGAIKQYMAMLWEQVKLYVSGAWDFIRGIFSGDTTLISQGLQKMWHAINTVLGGWPAKMMAMGRDILQGLISGIIANIGALKGAIGKVASKAVGTLKSLLGIHSPSRVFASLGGYTMQGFNVGLQRGERAPLARMQAFGGRLRQAGAGAALAAAAAPVMAGGQVPIDRRAPAAPAAAAPATTVYEIHIHAGAAGSPQDIAQAVRAELERIEREKAARTRSRFNDYGD